MNRNGDRIRRYADGGWVTVTGPTEPTFVYIRCILLTTYCPAKVNSNPDVLDILAVRGVYCHVHVSVISELFSDHCPMLSLIHI